MKPQDLTTENTENNYHKYAITSVSSVVRALMMNLLSQVKQFSVHSACTRVSQEQGVVRL